MNAKRRSMFILALLSLLVSACVPARVAQPVPMKQSADTLSANINETLTRPEFSVE
jgi:hypothetical protein